MLHLSVVFLAFSDSIVNVSCDGAAVVVDDCAASQVSARYWRLRYEHSRAEIVLASFGEVVARYETVRAPRPLLKDVAGSSSEQKWVEAARFQDPVAMSCWRTERFFGVSRNAGLRNIFCVPFKLGLQFRRKEHGALEDQTGAHHVAPVTGNSREEDEVLDAEV